MARQTGGAPDEPGLLVWEIEDVSPVKRGSSLFLNLYDLRLRRLGSLLAWRWRATAARIRSFRAASSTCSPSWMSMARLTFPSRLELNRPEGSFNAAPLGGWPTFRTLENVSSFAFHLSRCGLRADPAQAKTRHGWATSLHSRDFF